MKYLIFALLLLPAIPSSAGSYFVCTDSSGKKSFQDKPCSESQKQHSQKYETESITSSSGYDYNPLQLADQLGKDNRRRQLDRDIDKSEKKIRDYSRQMDSEIAALKAKKLRANNNIAGAQWETSISGEMTAVTAKYQALMDNERDRLSQLRSQRKDLTDN